MTFKSLQKIFYGLFFVIILTSNIISKYIGGINSIDETIAIFCLIYIFFHLNEVIRIKACNKILVLTLIIVCIGLVGNYLFNLQSNSEAIVKDIVAFAKMPIVACALISRKENTHLNDDIVFQSVQLVTKVFVIVVGILGIISLFKNIGMSWDYRNGIMSYTFLYTHPTFLTYALVVTSVILIANPNNSKYNFILLLNIFALVITMRNKAFAYVAFFIVVVYIIPFFKFKKIKLRYFILPLVVVLIISKNKISEYMNYSWSPREALYVNGLDLMKRSFPWGSGFATFASQLSGEYYANTYHIYNMDWRPGTSMENFVDLGDAGFPYYYACFGIFGFLLFVWLLKIVFSTALAFYKGQYRKYVAAVLLISYIIVALPFESTLTNESGVTVMVILFVYLGAKTSLVRENGK